MPTGMFVLTSGETTQAHIPRDHQLRIEHRAIKSLIARRHYDAAESQLSILAREVMTLKDSRWMIDISRDFGLIELGRENYASALDVFEAIRATQRSNCWYDDAAYTLSLIATIHLRLQVLEPSFELFREANGDLLAGSNRTHEIEHLRLMIQHPHSAWLGFVLSRRLIRLGWMLKRPSAIRDGMRYYIKTMLPWR